MHTTATRTLLLFIVQESTFVQLMPNSNSTHHGTSGYDAVVFFTFFGRFGCRSDARSLRRIGPIWSSIFFSVVCFVSPCFSTSRQTPIRLFTFHSRIRQKILFHSLRRKKSLKVAPVPKSHNCLYEFSLYLANIICTANRSCMSCTPAEARSIYTLELCCVCSELVCVCASGSVVIVCDHSLLF